jgi:CRP/FNR family transcriptional regulator
MKFKSEFQRIVLIETLRRSRLFAGSSESELNQIAEISLLKQGTRGDYIFREGETLFGFYIMQKGAVKLRQLNISGVEQILHVFRPCESFGEEMLFMEEGSAADACIIEDAQYVMVRKSEFIALLRRQPDLALRVLKSMDGHVRNLVGLLDDLTLKNVQMRIAEWLLQHCPDRHSAKPYTIQLHTKKKMIASELGTVSETFSRTLANFRRKHLLTVDHNEITLLSPLKLSSRLAEGAL